MPKFYEMNLSGIRECIIQHACSVVKQFATIKHVCTYVWK